MLKMYHNDSHSGSTPDYWEGNWETGEFERAVAFCAVDPLRPLFEKYLRPDSLMLEGGCGLGNYAAYYAARGYRVIGLDFAQRALQTLKKRQPHLPVCGGDVSRLPFADKTFDVYYSGGVVEHFEGGARDSLNEARRILKDDGVLLISVPYHSPLRRLLTPFRGAEWRTVTGSAIDDPVGFRDKVFFQYAYRPNEFQHLLAAAGLKVVSRQGYAVIWGLYELPFFVSPETNDYVGATSSSSSSPTTKGEPSLLKRLVVSEDASVPILGLGVKMMRWGAANMMMYVCRPG
jgi:SAM-dependent methyltransferase